jgi:hypothetical protein
VCCVLLGCCSMDPVFIGVRRPTPKLLPSCSPFAQCSKPQIKSMHQRRSMRGIDPARVRSWCFQSASATYGDNSAHRVTSCTGTPMMMHDNFLFLFFLQKEYHIYLGCRLMSTCCKTVQINKGRIATPRYICGTRASWVSVIVIVIGRISGRRSWTM